VVLICVTFAAVSDVAYDPVPDTVTLSPTYGFAPEYVVADVVSTHKYPTPVPP
jgi:hypothetical protein